MTPGKFDLNLYRGDSYSWTFRLWADDEKTVAVDLTGATVAAEIREKPAGTSVVALTCTITPPNTIDVAMPASLWTGTVLPAGVWDLEVIYPTGEVATVVAGKVTVTADVTNSTALVRNR
jgi:hypothetical protein